jgi:hypothetical protein
MEGNNLSLYEVKNDCEDCPSEEYSIGRELFIDYKFHWLSDNFVIKKEPDLSFYPNEIINILIKKAEYPAGQTSNYIVTIDLNDSASDRLREYTRANLNTKIALQLDDTILTIVSIKAVLEDGFSFALRNTNYEKIEDIFKTLSDNIARE